jgi:hypothetical protein
VAVGSGVGVGVAVGVGTGVGVGVNVGVGRTVGAGVPKLIVMQPLTVIPSIIEIVSINRDNCLHLK